MNIEKILSVSTTAPALRLQDLEAVIFQTQGLPLCELPSLGKWNLGQFSHGF